MINDGKERKALAIQTKEEGEGGPLLYLLSGEGEGRRIISVSVFTWKWGRELPIGFSLRQT